MCSAVFHFSVYYGQSYGCGFCCYWFAVSHWDSVGWPVIIISHYCNRISVMEGLGGFHVNHVWVVRVFFKWLTLCFYMFLCECVRVWVLPLFCFKRCFLPYLPECQSSREWSGHLLICRRAFCAESSASLISSVVLVIPNLSDLSVEVIAGARVQFCVLLDCCLFGSFLLC